MSERSEQLSKSLKQVRQQIESAALACHRDPADITLIVVTKNFPSSDVQILYDLGERNFGENRDQEGREKSLTLPDDVTWNFQGQIQSKKLRSIVGWADIIHSLDDLRHAHKIAELCQDLSASVFVQVSLDPLENSVGRGGVNPEHLRGFLQELSKTPALKILGLMAVAPLQESPGSAFTRLAKIRAEVLTDFPQVSALSCGMSGDFEEAIAAGATHIRIGSSILGSR